MISCHKENYSILNLVPPSQIIFHKSWIHKSILTKKYLIQKMSQGNLDLGISKPYSIEINILPHNPHNQLGSMGCRDKKMIWCHHAEILQKLSFTHFFPSPCRYNIVFTQFLHDKGPKQIILILSFLFGLLVYKEALYIVAGYRTWKF